jgi:hypothetical integral membrane protein (TIGR02206 family)
MQGAFRPFSLAHLATVLFFGSIAAAIIVLGARWQGRGAQRGLELALASFTGAMWLAVTIWAVLPANYDPAFSFPINVCDLVALLVPFALVKPGNVSYALLYFWGLTLSVQGIITPDLSHGPDTLAFWLFWAHHVVIVGAALYVVIVRGFRPTLRHLGIAVGVGLAWLAIVFPLNVAFGWNYGYVGDGLPAQPSLIDVLGPWPLRVLWMVLLASAAMLLLLVPWLGARRSRLTSSV